MKTNQKGSTLTVWSLFEVSIRQTHHLVTFGPKNLHFWAVRGATLTNRNVPCTALPI